MRSRYLRPKMKRRRILHFYIIFLPKVNWQIELSHRLICFVCADSEMASIEESRSIFTFVVHGKFRPNSIRSESGFILIMIIIFHRKESRGCAVGKFGMATTTSAFFSRFWYLHLLVRFVRHTLTHTQQHMANLRDGDAHSTKHPDFYHLI